MNFGAHSVRLAEDVDRCASRDELRAQGTLRTIPNEEDKIPGIADVILQMMPNTACLRHARSANNNHRVFELIQLLRVRNLADVREIFHTKRVFSRAEKVVDL